MEIVNKNKEVVEFEKLSTGEVFRDLNSNICMKTDEYDCNVNAVRLVDGSFYYHYSQEKVERVHCKLIIEN